MVYQNTHPLRFRKKESLDEFRGFMEENKYREAKFTDTDLTYFTNHVDLYLLINRKTSEKGFKDIKKTLNEWQGVAAQTTAPVFFKDFWHHHRHPSTHPDLASTAYQDTLQHHDMHARKNMVLLTPAEEFELNGSAEKEILYFQPAYRRMEESLIAQKFRPVERKGRSSQYFDEGQAARLYLPSETLEIL